MSLIRVVLPCWKEFPAHAQMMNARWTYSSPDPSWFDGATQIKGHILIQCLIQFSHEDIIHPFNFY